MLSLTHSISAIVFHASSTKAFKLSICCHMRSSCFLIEIALFSLKHGIFSTYLSGISWGVPVIWEKSKRDACICFPNRLLHGGGLFWLTPWFLGWLTPAIGIDWRFDELMWEWPKGELRWPLRIRDFPKQVRWLGLNSEDLFYYDLKPLYQL